MRDFLLGIPVIGGLLFSLLWLLLWVASIILTVYGLVLAFSTNVVLGIVVLILEPAPLVIGLMDVFGQINLARVVFDWVVQHAH